MAICYIIFSKALNRFYTGVTNLSIQERLEKHNDSTYGNHRFTAKANDWEVYIVIEVNEYSHAMRLERKIKAQKSAKYIRNLKTYPDLIEKITQQTK